jgi:hypothetical protein
MSALGHKRTLICAGRHTVFGFPTKWDKWRVSHFFNLEIADGRWSPAALYG